MSTIVRTFILVSLALAPWFAAAAEEATEAQEESAERVKYALILPEEKTPELVKETEQNPFEPKVRDAGPQEGTTEENLVRDILLRLPAVGGASGSQGMRVMLGGMRLIEGATVPPVIPDQQVTLQVKSITSGAIELIWVDKKNTNLPPKTLTIPLDVGPKVRHQLPAQVAPPRQAPVTGMGTIRRNGVPVLVSPVEVTANAPSAMALPPPGSRHALAPDAEVAVQQESVPPPQAAPPDVDPLPPPSGASQASVLRMLFGNHAPAGK